MPIELAPDAVDRTLALLGEHDLATVEDVEVALESMAAREDEAEPIALSRYDLQLFLWHQLPRKFLAPLETKERIAAGLGRFLELAGGPAAKYAEICGSPDTRRLLRAWEGADHEAAKMLQGVLDASGIEPPDTDALEWGEAMGPEEARLHREVALALERALEDGRLTLGERGFPRRRAALVLELVRSPRAELDGRAPVDLVLEERLADWVRRGSEKRRELLAAVEQLLRDREPDASRAADTDGPLEPLAWLLEMAVNGITLTQTGALSRALVRTAVERYPRWWRNDLFGPPQREDDVFSLRQVHGLARRTRLLRRRGRKLLLTRRGDELREDGAALLEGCAPRLLAADGFTAAVQELVAAVLLDRGRVDGREMELEVQRAILAEGWHADGEPPRLEDVAGAASGLVALGDALGLVHPEYEFDRETGRARRDLELTSDGRVGLRLALRARAVGPARML
ncbi:MAG: hypothetical protein ACRDK5_10280 [Solirubrobacterales bacterium]